MSTVPWWRSARARTILRTEVFRDSDIRIVERVPASVRVGVVVSVGLLLAVGPPAVRQHLAITLVWLGIGSCYALVVFRDPTIELRSRWSSLLVTGLDSALTLAIITVTGGSSSLAVSLLFLVIAAAAMRLSFVATVSLSLALGVAYFVIALVVDDGSVPLTLRLQQGTWWPLYLVFMAALTGGFVLLTERATQAHTAARALALAERAAADEERDLRSRLMKSYEAQETGLQVILHEFRTPIASLKALTDNLAEHTTSAAEDDDHATSVRLLAAHASHLSSMMDALGDVAASRRPTFSTGRRRIVDVREFLYAAGDAAGLAGTELRIMVTPEGACCRLDPQLLRRVLTNLVENAGRHSRGTPVEVVARLEPDRLRVMILDRGPGIPAELAPRVTDQFVSAGERRGTAGLGLWIADQIVRSLDGRISLRPRSGGGLVVYLEVPVD
ncbi:HAMP domain-containing sensor histidine kinase [Amycolatopsis sp. SID8362]|uniref:sensor histidine kinase n=1 Tax=Amycolatopsis sp. SID8362 TaxID=2690346 RepID=UPI0013722CCE|nr:HAMP domain-containing sensor histidine kinase [Amycolatopsis sp. SID8362]NBH07479.1 sensor histidine kinase [Amycolatopsis sp. SID8362]NED44175.1 HAMP domain-containing histidine kinase [Amycolatopsis sp. SID8362]